MRFIPANVHNILDYVVGIVLLLAPNIFGFSDVGGAPVTVARVFGIIVLLMGLITRGYSYSVLKLLPLPVHMWGDVLGGIILALSPWIFSFSDEKATAWVPHLIVGIALIGVGLFTSTVADNRTAAATA